MATVLPRTWPGPGQRVSESELDVLKHLSDGPDDWTILHSLWLKTHWRKADAQADFVIVGSGWVLVLEAKGGQVWRDDEGWHFGSRPSDTKAEGPVEQARGAQYAIRKHLESIRRPDLLNEFVWGYGAVFPDCVLRVTSRDSSVDPEMILDLKGYPTGLTRFIVRLAEYWAQRTQKPLGGDRAPLVHKARDLVDCVRPHIERVVGVGAQAVATEAQLLKLTKAQLSALDYSAAEPRNILVGAAGTGKTVLAVEQARRKAMEGHRVLFVCFNKLLAMAVDAGLRRDGVKGVTVGNYHHLLLGLLRRHGVPRVVSEDWGEFSHWLRTAALEIAAELGPDDQFDYLVIDEAQDLMSREFLELLGCLLVGGLDGGGWLLAIDTQQVIFRDNFDADLFSEIRRAGRRVALEINCRNSRPIAAYVRALTGAGAVSCNAAAGEDPVFRYYEDRGEYLRLLRDTVNGLIRGFADAGVAASEITILTADNSFLPDEVRKAGFFLRGVVDADPANHVETHVRVATVQSFKGLESLAVVLVGIERFDQSILRDLFYVGASRARTTLRVLLPVSCTHVRDSMAEIIRLISTREAA